MPSTVPSLAAMTGPYDEHIARLADISPVLPAVQARHNNLKEIHFRSGRGPNGPHRGLKPSTLRRHRTGVPLWNTKHLGRSYYDPGHVHYHWDQDAAGWEHHSSHPARPHLRRMGFTIDGFSMEGWDYLEEPVIHYLDTGEIIQ